MRRLCLNWLATASLAACLGPPAAAQTPPRAKPVAPAAAVPPGALQLIVALADSWNANRGWLMAYERTGPNAAWQAGWNAPVPVLFGKNGLAWGRGVIPVPHGQGGVPSKQERDARAPAGFFKIGMLFGYAKSLPAGAQYPYYQVTSRDCWIDDINHPAYNRHVTVDVKNPPPWYEKQKMRLGDFAYEWLLEIRHNADPPAAGAGSAIFFHIRRGADRPSAGCTTMARDSLIQLIQWIRAEKNPHYVLLPRAEYNARQVPWRLPPAFIMRKATR